MQTLTPKQKRAEIKRILYLLSEENREMFNRMYSPQDIDREVSETVDSMPAKQLSWALQQCQNSYHRIFKVIKHA